MDRRGLCTAIIATVAILSLGGCMQIRPEATQAERTTPAVTPPPARGEAAAGSAEDYPDERKPAPPAKQQELPEVTWGPLPVPVYPGARLSTQSHREVAGEKPTAYRNFNYTTGASRGRVLAFYKKQLGEDIEVLSAGRQVTIIKDLEKGNVVISIVPRSGYTEISIQESQKLEPKKRGLFGRK